MMFRPDIIWQRREFAIDYLSVPPAHIRYALRLIVTMTRCICKLERYEY